MQPDAAASQIVKVYLHFVTIWLISSSRIIFTPINSSALVRNPLLTCFSCQQEAVGVKGLKDDTTCIVVDLQAPEKSPLAPPKKQGISAFKSMFKRKSSESPLAVEKYYNEPDEVEELVEEGSAMLSERYVAAILHPVVITIFLVDKSELQA